MTTPCLRVENLNVFYDVGGKKLHAAKDVSLEIAGGETLGLVGESGSGKSTAGLAILRLIEPLSGQVMLGDTDVTLANRTDLRAMRKRMQMVFQDPYSSLNPSMTIEQLLSEPLIIHADMPKSEQRCSTNMSYSSNEPSSSKRSMRSRALNLPFLC